MTAAVCSRGTADWIRSLGPMTSAALDAKIAEGKIVIVDENGVKHANSNSKNR